MYTEKMSISVPHIMVNFIDQYKSEHMCKSKSEVIV
jgi:metal-responsive CopG/Arc/MetJ family transcriptional regulator